MRFHPLEKLINLHDGYIGRFRIDDLELLLIDRDGQRHLIESRCPHRGHPLDVASIGPDTIECALHHYRFSLAEGQVLVQTEEPCRDLRVFDLIYEGNEVGLMLPE